MRAERNFVSRGPLWGACALALCLWANVSVAAQPTSGMPQRATFGAGGALYVTYANGAGPFGSSGYSMPSTNPAK